MTDLYALPDLPYSYDALEPWCPAETLELHHKKHHAAYVLGANDAAEALGAVDPSDALLLGGIQTALTFNLGGHVLHSLFWTSMCPTKSPPTGALADQIGADFGSLDVLTTQLAAACKGVQGSGWGVISFHPVDRKLHVGQMHDHQQQLIPDTTLLAVIDVWEHAYYLKYRNERASWVGAVIEHLDWTAIGSRFETISMASALPS
jgi:superoxide dismutase, Fe-Mn family